MPNRREQLVFTLTVLGAAAILVSIAAAQILLGAALLMWILFRPAKPRVPVYFYPLLAFMAATVVAVAVSPDPGAGMPVIRKFILFPMGLLAATFVNSVRHARIAVMALLGTAAVTSVWALVQFAVTYARYLQTGALEDDPMITARITGFMGHWMTFSGLHLLVWCAALPALLALGRRWIAPLALVGVTIILSFTRSVWLGAAAGFAVAALLLPRRALAPVLVPLMAVALIASPLIYHRVAASFNVENFGPDLGRMELWKAGLRMIQTDPFAGVGPERIAVEFPRYFTGNSLNFYYGHLHNNFMQIAAERGLIAFAAFLWFLLEVFASLWRIRKAADPETSWIITSGLAAMTGFVIAGIGEYNFGDSEVLMLLLFVISIPYGVVRTAGVAQNAED